MATRYWLILAAIGAAFGVSFACNALLLATYGPLTVSALRVAIGAVGCWAWVLVTGRGATLPFGTVPGIALFGVFQFALPFAVLPLAQQHIASSTAGIANAMTPAAMVVISHMWPGGERATVAKVAGVGFGAAGIAILATRGVETARSDPRFVLLALGAPACYAIALNFARRFRGIDPVVMTAWAMTGGCLAIVPVALALDGMPAAPDATALVALLVVGVGLTSVTFIVMYSILPRVGATNLSLVTFVAPISATVVGALGLGEVIGLGHLLGMAMILAGLVTIDGRITNRLVRCVARPTPAARGATPST